ncbi:MAG: V-type ATP synthase subunit D [Spirochaetia bacterium]|jgi:V/A-type H+-transporting ATPase subunit D|nr:V-type ATP synthase subunit D [Spirochaetia bacterium]
MANIKLTKNELKSQKDSLKRFQRYLPTLILKKQQLQMVIRQVEIKIKEVESQRDELYSSLQVWIAVYGEKLDLSALIKIKTIDKDMGNIAGVDIPVFRELTFDMVSYDIFKLPLWIDKGLDAIKAMAAFDAEVEVLKEQIKLLGDELRITTQRVNLFEKVKIPNTKTNIRKIQIYIGDKQTAAVVRGKMAKNKIVKVS